MRSQTRRILEGFFNLHKQQMKRDSMIFYRSFYESVNGLSPVIKAELYDAIFEYGLNFQEIEFTNEISKALFTLIKPQLDANIKRFENGKKPKTKQIESKTEAKDKQNESKVEANNNVNVNVNDNEIIKENIKEKAARFTPPTADEVKTYMQEQAMDDLSEKFVNFYEAKGWQIGKNKMKDWKAAVRTWKSNYKDKGPQTTVKPVKASLNDE